MPRPKWLVLWIAVWVAFGACAAQAGAVTTYLRPNFAESAKGWSVIGAPTAWEALDDPVTEAQVPNNGDYISSVPNVIGTQRLGFETMSLAGVQIASATVWFYKLDNAPLHVELQSKGLNTSASFSAPGWASINIPIGPCGCLPQTRIDQLELLFEPGGRSASATRSVSAAFIRLDRTVPAPRVYWGAWIDGDVYTDFSKEAPWPDAPWQTEAKPTWRRFNEDSGNKGVSIVHFGQPTPWNQQFEPGPLNAIVEGGAIPMMDMDPDGVSLSSLASSNPDEATKKRWEAVEAWAEAVAKYKKPFFFRWSWEMNGTWFKPYGPESAASPALYKEVWRHFFDITKAKGATNITWLWCPNVSFEGSTSLSSLYPGDAYVDWTCMDGYDRGNNPLAPEGYKTFPEVFSQTYQELLSVAPNKPIMIGEFAATENAGLSETKAEWIAEALGTSLAKSFPNVRAVVWFNWNIPDDEEPGKRWDWPIESSLSSQASFANVISSPYFSANTFGGLPALAKIQPLP